MSGTNAFTRSGHSRTRATVLDWGLRVILAVFFAAVAIPKLVDVHSSAHMFAEIGAGHWFQYFVGTAELAGAIGLLIPPLTGLAATGLCLDMIGASVVNVTVLHSAAVVLTLPLAFVFAVLACRHGAMTWLRGNRQTAVSGLATSPQQRHERLDELLVALQADTDT
ncbi:MAG: DoxX family protein [Mycobacterium sp.]